VADHATGAFRFRDAMNFGPRRLTACLRAAYPRCAQGVLESASERRGIRGLRI